MEDDGGRGGQENRGGRGYGRHGRKGWQVGVLKSGNWEK